ncbi:DUF4290 domain-containing protein [Flammeovirga sp. EKP202]|uniref:DUF4290 domain-containing protein n=1 Tax=Flammeovirga sp. EKP202 TaxID=2770592 RepID=UPI00165FC694|nr:DUF4290 domain-containing protein [Flammeovirga sp. EKP202]MBD0400887.1 DUF4290 domain-containing protein [Flammeovirga sp. EKP202]
MRDEHSYNTSRSDIILKEYGRNIEGLVQFISSLEDKSLRTQYAYTLIALMKQLHPIQKQLNDSQQRIWDHLQVMSDFKLDIDSPYPAPKENMMFSKPRRVEYTQSNIRFRHFGKNLEAMVQNALELETKEDVELAFSKIVKLMKSFYSAQVNNQIEDDVIMNTLSILSKGKVNMKEVKAKYPDAFKNVKLPSNTAVTTSSSNNSSSKSKKRRKKRRK